MDANTNLVQINPANLHTAAPVNLSSVNGEGGFDDILFAGSKAYLSVSNPANDPNTDPAIVSAKLSGGSVSTSPYS